VWFNGVMFDGVLDKAGFVARLKELGYSDEEISSEWKKLEDEFYRQVLVAVYDGLSGEEKGRLSPDGDFGEAIDKVVAYVKENLSKLDGNGIIKSAAMRAQENYLKGFKVEEGIS